MEITQTLRSLGIGRQYLGYSITVRALQMVLRDENCLFCIKQNIFMPLAEQTGSDWRSIERNIRTVIHRAWYINPALLEEMAGYSLERSPTVTEFIEMVSSYLIRKHPYRMAINAAREQDPHPRR